MRAAEAGHDGAVLRRAGAEVVGQFSVSVAKFVQQTKDDADQACRAIALEMLSRIVLKSPVGNPELWKANQASVYGRETFNLFVDASNAADAASGAKRKPLRRKGKRALASQFPLKAGKGYVGGAFRRNWQLTITSPASGVLPGVDPSGGQAIAAAAAVLSAFKAGPVIHINNNLPYGPALEFEGHSSQAPAGMVRVTLTELESVLNESVAGIAK